ncbi:glycoside hydrolase family 1 protein [Photobacterium sp. ZSDE20]|uniref:Glycoside hydrolase family 1 protein n=1 Tax=Photobacterium pectinilyticum TaxID=2906793 RepID=A0ABT1N192_9GAMM|nr:glycoside hydrolase family 1 protein [Photobacterium sp. ZSDE20]MCQ1058444.1 glycoside hydrolase family 1 protein [Photobacterium sp. ZSDE20]MDD1823167.1 glycoside hydrolase family 1 protein [Photobacterium sp. ZSDE20]
MSFQDEFLWGSASAAYQIEGAANLDGKGDSIWDVYSRVPGNTFKNTTGEVAIDFYHRFEQDIALMKEMGLQAYRFSVSWPRIMTDGRSVNPKGVEFYHKVIDTLIANDITPILTVYHWDLPQALQDDYQGWESREIIEDFTRYCEILFQEYGDKVPYWVSLNEQNIFTSLGYLQAIHPPKVSDFQRFINANHIANLANASAVKKFREMGIEAKIGASFAYSPAYAQSAKPEDVIAAEDAQELQDLFWMDVYAKGRYPKIALKRLETLNIHIDFQPGDKELLAAGVCDFMGLNYYQSATFVAAGNKQSTAQTGNASQVSVVSEISDIPTDKLFARADNEYLDMTDWNWAIDPNGLRVALRRITSRYELPILISENGLGAFDTLTEEGKVHDDYRINFLRRHVEAISDAIDDGCEVIGYCTWSCQDLFSWLNGYAKRYGFIYVDRDEESEKELKRYKKDSFYWYQKVIQSNGKQLD